MLDGSGDYRLTLPRKGPQAQGRLLDARGENYSKMFVVREGSPVRQDVVPSFPTRGRSQYRRRQELIENGTIVESRRYPGYLEAAEDIECYSPSEAASIVLGRKANGWTEWVDGDGRTLGEFLGQDRIPGSAWFVRSSAVPGSNVFTRMWLPRHLVTLPASLLRHGIKPDIPRERLSQYVDEDYGSASTYSQRQQYLEEFYNFWSRMQPGDTVCTISEGNLYLGEITGPARQTRSEGGQANLQRAADWQDFPFEYTELPDEIQRRISVRGDVADLSPIVALLAGLGRSDEELEAEIADDDASAEIVVLETRKELERTLELPVITPQFAKDDLLVHDISWPQELREILWEEKQVILYGPPGTGKTYLARKIAHFLGGSPERVTFVQFHPSYSYEDFFEGFRPQLGTSGEATFKIVDGPLRTLANEAAKPENRHLPYFLVIDEINRAHLAKVFGELYFLLEYRYEKVKLTYSPQEFWLPDNLFIIGTMNTVDRSVTSLDAAIRRRFAFLELSPAEEPTRGLLRRWIEQRAGGSTPSAVELEAANLLDELNRRIPDPDFRVGPAYLMKDSVYRDGGIDRVWRTKILPLLVEFHAGDGTDVPGEYGLDALRDGLTTAGGEPAS
ncbi:DUF4357 domain-containing protein [Nocardia sp. NPDC005998]|uniref:DUF4357 domain-containing protein n=1 Tax=Nocardia sp. NPDC005998 TaxID=3156894 RepID=UPI0033A6D1A6